MICCCQLVVRTQPAAGSPVTWRAAVSSSSEPSTPEIGPGREESIIINPLI